ncbi:MAG: AAA family ATPase [Sulfuricurvum sp.]|nr:AAA family ATPase [Sulfuricurvum sp.]
MELVYLWVEDYKNIHQQGFNFSGRYRCDYDHEKNELTIDENKEYVHVFPKNINITAIVGENGSGKSSIFEVLTFLFYQGVIANREDKTFFLFYKDDRFFIQCENYKHQEIELEDFIEIKNNTSIAINKQFCARTMMPLIHFSNCISDITKNHRLKNLNNYDKFYNGIQPKIPSMPSEDSYDNFNLKFQSIMKENDTFFNFVDENFIFDSYQCEIHFQEIEVSIVQYDNKEFSEYISFQNKKHLNNEELLYKMLIILAIEMATRKIYNSRHSSLKPNTANAEILKQYIKENIEDKIINIIDNFNDSFLSLTLEICKNSLEKIDESFPKEIFDVNLFSSYSQYEPKEPMNTFHKFFEDYSVPQSNTIFQSQIFKIEDNYLENIYSNELLNFMMNNNILRCNFLNSKKNNCHFLELSSGEKLFLNVLTNFSYTLFRLQDDFRSVLLFDEIELSFHPNWQKKLLKSFIHIQDEISKGKRLYFHLIFTSHSPFLLSDLPKKNVMFLKDGKKDNPDIQQTFGANIHTLLSHGFFMNDGLMGEFAKSKINEVITLLNRKRKLSKKNQKFCKDIISIIGEPLLQNTLHHQLNQKLDTNETELQKLEREQKEIQAKIDKLKSTHHETN